MAAITAEGWNKWYKDMGKHIPIEGYGLLKWVAKKQYRLIAATVVASGVAAQFGVADMVLRAMTFLPRAGLGQLLRICVEGLSWPFVMLAYSWGRSFGAAIRWPFANLLNLPFIGENVARVSAVALLRDFRQYMRRQPSYVVENVSAYLSYAIATMRCLLNRRMVPTVLFKIRTRRLKRLTKTHILPSNLPPAQTNRRNASSSSNTDDEYDDDTGGPSVPDETGEGIDVVWSVAPQPGAAMPESPAPDEEVGDVTEGVEGMEVEEAGESSAPNTAMPESSVTEGCDRLWCHEAMDK